MMWLRDLEAIRPTLDAWNRDIQRSIDEYATHPSAACSGVNRVDDKAIPCDLLAETDSRLCRKHQHEREQAAKRMRVARGAR